MFAGSVLTLFFSALADRYATVIPGEPRTASSVSSSKSFLLIKERWSSGSRNDMFENQYLLFAHKTQGAHFCTAQPLLPVEN